MIRKNAFRIAKKIYNIGQSKDLLEWKRIQGDKNLRLNYNLDTSSIVFDLGGYEGQWASDIYAMYRCKVFIFEPVKHFADNIAHRFEKNPDIIVCPFGLSDETKEMPISVDANSSSLYRPGTEHEVISLKRAADFLTERGIITIDLVKINIEGGEYDLLEHLITTGIIKNIKNIQVQFHDFVPNAKVRMEQIRESLEKTHHITYGYEFVWENWEVNK